MPCCAWPKARLWYPRTRRRTGESDQAAGAAVCASSERAGTPSTRGFSRGLSIPDLAAELYLGASTVKTHTQRLYEKLGVSDRAAAVAEGMRQGLLE